MSTTQVADVANTVPALAVKNLVKTYGTVGALNGVNLAASPGKVHCLLGDNGAGKSTLIKILSGVTQPSAGELSAAGRPIKFNSPREALIQGVATVYQDLAVIPMMSVFRNFFLGRELSRGWGPLSRFDTHRAKEITITEMAKMGINIQIGRAHV